MKESESEGADHTWVHPALIVTSSWRSGQFQRAVTKRRCSERSCASLRAPSFPNQYSWPRSERWRRAALSHHYNHSHSAALLITTSPSARANHGATWHLGHMAKAHVSGSRSHSCSELTQHGSAHVQACMCETRLAIARSSAISARSTHACIWASIIYMG
eukprot:359821-Chlamydomonas_euryale.AAC.3